jgi:hypothetical protein
MGFAQIVTFAQKVRGFVQVLEPDGLASATSAENIAWFGRQPSVLSSCQGGWLLMDTPWTLGVTKRPSMEIDIRWAVNLFFASPSFSQIYFESVANAFDADATEIEIHISTDGKIKPGHLEITISDNGQGFTDARFDCFARLKKPIDVYHKGLGRFVYLHYFSRVYIDSAFDGKKRQFTFSAAFSGDSETAEVSQSEKRKTVLRFDGFQGGRLKSYDDVRPAILKEKIIEHFLPFFHERKKKEKPFKVVIELETKSTDEQGELYPDSQSITSADIPEFECKAIHDDSIHAFDDISMSYMVRSGMGERQCLTAASVDSRTIPMKLLPANAIPLNWSAIFLFESKLFTGNSDSSRQRLVLPESIPEDTLNRLLRREISAVLNGKLPEIEARNAATKRQLEERYPHLTGYFEEDTVGIINKEEAIEIAQNNFFKQQKEVLESTSLDDATFAKALKVSARTLTAYVLYREHIIKRLRTTTGKDREEIIHNLIVPRFQEFRSDAGGLVEGIYTNNAWILDDKFMSFRTILSDRSMSELISAVTLSGDPVEAQGRPDISIVFSADPDRADVENVEVVVVELKGRQRDDKENTFVAVQLMKRAELLADHCPKIQRVWYYGIIDIDDDLKRTLLGFRWAPLFSKGRVFYNDLVVVRKADGALVPTPTYLLTFDAIIEDAAARNHTFLEILKSDIRKAKINPVEGESLPGSGALPVPDLLKR